MKTSLFWKLFLIGCLLLALFTGCATTEPETPTLKLTSCEEVEGICLWLTFDGESCTYDGPTDIKAGPVTFLFLNESGGPAAANMVRHTGDETIQDMIDYIGEEPSPKHHPSWSVDIRGVYRFIPPGESYTWEGVLEPGIHTMVCSGMKKLGVGGVWFGAGLMVED